MEKSISYINDTINKSNGHFLSHNELKGKYNIKTKHIATSQIHSSIPNNWNKTLKQNIYSTPITNIQHNINVNKSKLDVEKAKCKDYYWHLIINISPKSISPWENIYTN